MIVFRRQGCWCDPPQEFVSVPLDRVVIPPEGSLGVAGTGLGDGLARHYVEELWMHI